MASATEHFGEGIDTSVFTPWKQNSKGELRACLGRGNYSYRRRWYGI